MALRGAARWILLSSDGARLARIEGGVLVQLAIVLHEANLFIQPSDRKLKSVSCDCRIYVLIDLK